MKDISDNRRNFLKKMLTASVLTAACPHLLLGKIEPEIDKKNNEILGTYKVKISKYPELQREWGSVVMSVEGVFGFFPKIIVTRVPKDIFNCDFTALVDQCPHEGFVMAPFNEETYTFTCTGQGSIFNVEGGFVWGPASGRVLPRLELRYEGGDDILIEVPALIDSAAAETNEQMSFLTVCRPNPCADSANFDFGIEKPSSAEIRISRNDGSILKVINYKYLDAGTHSVHLDVSAFPSGAYNYELITKNNRLVKQFVVQK